ncbi:Pex12 amino terminal region-domain-containing protein [Powellomyces hirtus]|nr:Pex12 amino terminal region-domain-containing protein [Powellomyces hirtus]
MDGGQSTPPSTPPDLTEPTEAIGFWEPARGATLPSTQVDFAEAPTSERHALTATVKSASQKEELLSVAQRALTAYPRPSLNVLRVSQLDAELLDTELTTLLKEQLISVFAFFKPNVKDAFEPEITAVLQYIMCHMSIYAMGASYGLQLQNLKYRDESRHQGRLERSAVDAPLSRWQKVAHALLFIGGRWGLLRLNRYATTHEWSEDAQSSWRNRVWRYLQKAHSVYKALSLANFLAFLYNGKYRSLLDRILRMRLVYSRRETGRQVSFEFMNRQLVWHAFTEFLLFLVPLINIERVKNSITRAISGPVTVDLPAHICAICHAEDRPKSTIHNPYVTNCGHVYCYYCIKTSIMVDHAFPCPRCGSPVRDIVRATA